MRQKSFFFFLMRKTSPVTPAVWVTFSSAICNFRPSFLALFSLFNINLWIKFHSCNHHCTISSNLSEKLNNHSHLSPLSEADSHFIRLNLFSSNWPWFSSSQLIPSWLLQDTLAPADFNPDSTSSDSQEVFQTGRDPGNNNNVQATYSPQAKELEHPVPCQWDINRTGFKLQTRSGLL